MTGVTGRQLLLLTATIIVVASVVGGLVLVGPPAEQHRRRVDGRRVSDLQAFARAVDSYWTRHGALPISAEVVEKEQFLAGVRDPESGDAYRYRVTGEKSFELCATFATRSEEFVLRAEPDSRSGSWAHDRGAWCFALDAHSGGRK